MLYIIFQVFLYYQCLNVAKFASGNNYLTVNLTGELNLMLTAPHGGSITTFTPQAPDREDGCYKNDSCVFEHGCETEDATKCEVKTLADLHTDEITDLLCKEVYKLKGKYPKKVISNIHRKKLDPNRERNEATFGQEIPSSVFKWYHSNISEGLDQFQGEPGLLLDIHGYSDGEDTGWAMLGYLISKTRLNTLAGDDLNAIVNDSSIKHLVAAKSTETFSSLLRGPDSFGAFMEKYGLGAVPSPNNTGPGTKSYLSGGYTTATYRNKENIDVIQVEIHYFHRKNSINRQFFAEKLAGAIVEFYDKHYEQTPQLSTSTESAQNIANIYKVNVTTVLLLLCVDILPLR